MKKLITVAAICLGIIACDDDSSENNNNTNNNGECSASTQRCEGDTPVVCNPETLVWEALGDACDTSCRLIGEEALCMTCTDQCTSGATQCSENTLQTCTLTGNGTDSCYNWTDYDCLQTSQRCVTEGDSSSCGAPICSADYLNLCVTSQDCEAAGGFWADTFCAINEGLAQFPPTGNPDGTCQIPADAHAADSSNPTTVVGDGTPESCTSEAFVSAVAEGGVITFNCGDEPVIITLTQTAKIFNDTTPEIVIDGGNMVTLNGDGARRILYMNTCDPDQVWTTPHCDNQDHPRLTIQNLTFMNGNSTGQNFDGGGGGAVFVRGGRVKIVNSRFFTNQCEETGPDIGGAAVRVLSQYENLPAYVVNSTFGGREDLGNYCSNGGGLSSIGVSYTVINSLFSFNEAIGYGANPAQSGTPGGGSGGAIYNDGNTFTLTVCGTSITDNHANEGGGAIFFVSNDLSGHLVITDSTLARNPSDGFETQGYPGIFVLSADTTVTNSTLE